MRCVIVGMSTDGRSTVIHDGPPTKWFMSEPATSMVGAEVTPPVVAQLGQAVIAQAYPVDGAVLGARPIDSAAPPVEGPCRASFVTFGRCLTTPMHHDVNLAIGVVVCGRVTLALETTEVDLATGDMVINPGLEHAWRTGDDGATLAFVAVPLPR